MSMGWSKKVDNGSKEYYKKSWQSKNPFISSTLPVTKGRGRKHRDLAWIMLKGDLAHTEKSIGRGGGDFSGARGQINHFSFKEVRQC
jgi:hypothetical protein